MRRNELLTTTAVAPEATASSAAPIATTTELGAKTDSTPPVQTYNVSIYRFGKSVYKVRTHFNLECTETLVDVIGRLISQDINDTDN